MQSPDKNTKLTWTSHVTKLVDVTPSDSTEYDPPLRLLQLKATGTDGPVTVVAADDPDSAAQPFTLDADHPIENIAIKKVMSTGTTATGIVGGR